MPGLAWGASILELIGFSDLAKKVFRAEGVLERLDLSIPSWCLKGVWIDGLSKLFASKKVEKPAAITQAKKDTELDLAPAKKTKLDKPGLLPHLLTAGALKRANEDTSGNEWRKIFASAEEGKISWELVVSGWRSIPKDKYKKLLDICVEKTLSREAVGLIERLKTKTLTRNDFQLANNIDTTITSSAFSIHDASVKDLKVDDLINAAKKGKIDWKILFRACHNRTLNWKHIIDAAKEGVLPLREVVDNEYYFQDSEQPASRFESNKEAYAKTIDAIKSNINPELIKHQLKAGRGIFWDTVFEAAYLRKGDITFDLISNAVSQGRIAPAIVRHNKSLIPKDLYANLLQTATANYKKGFLDFGLAKHDAEELEKIFQAAREGKLSWYNVVGNWKHIPEDKYKELLDIAVEKTLHLTLNPFFADRKPDFSKLLEKLKNGEDLTEDDKCIVYQNSNTILWAAYPTHGTTTVNGLTMEHIINASEEGRIGWKMLLQHSRFGLDWKYITDATQKGTLPLKTILSNKRYFKDFGKITLGRNPAAFENIIQIFRGKNKTNLDQIQQWLRSGNISEHEWEKVFETAYLRPDKVSFNSIVEAATKGKVPISVIRNNSPYIPEESYDKLLHASVKANLGEDKLNKLKQAVTALGKDGFDLDVLGDYCENVFIAARYNLGKINWKYVEDNVPKEYILQNADLYTDLTDFEMTLHSIKQREPKVINLASARIEMDCKAFANKYNLWGLNGKEILESIFLRRLRFSDNDLVKYKHIFESDILFDFLKEHYSEPKTLDALAV